MLPNVTCYGSNVILIYLTDTLYLTLISYDQLMLNGLFSQGAPPVSLFPVSLFPDDIMVIQSESVSLKCLVSLSCLFKS